MKSLSILGLVGTTVSAYQDKEAHGMLTDMKAFAVEGVKEQIHT